MTLCLSFVNPDLMAAKSPRALPVPRDKGQPPDNSEPSRDGRQKAFEAIAR